VKVIQKSYLGAKTYFNLEDYKAALTALKSSLADYPETQYREEILYDRQVKLHACVSQYRKQAARKVSGFH